MSGYRQPPQSKPDQQKMAARQAGQTKFIGNDCKYGHGGVRYVSTGNCVACIQHHRDRKIIKEAA